MDKKIEHLSTTRIAKLHNIRATPELFDFLIKKGLIIRNEARYELTKKGVEIGGIYQSKYHGKPWIAWTKNSLDSIIKEFKKISESIVNYQMLIVDELEIKHEYNQYDDIAYYIVVATVKNDEEHYYELKQQIVDDKKSIKLVQKIEEKGFINPIYWKCKKMENYSDYGSDEENYYDDDDKYNKYNDGYEKKKAYIGEGEWVYEDDPVYGPLLNFI